MKSSSSTPPSEATITLQDGTVLKAGDTALALNGLRRWAVVTIKEVLPGGGVDRAVTSLGIKGRYALKARKP
jgi:hypothetical protein